MVGARAARGAVEDLVAVVAGSEALAVVADFLVAAEDRRGDFNLAARRSPLAVRYLRKRNSEQRAFHTNDGSEDGIKCP